MRKLLLATCFGAVATFVAGAANANDALNKMSQDPKGWVMPAGDYANTRYSKLNQITAANVGGTVKLTGKALGTPFTVSSSSSNGGASDTQAIQRQTVFTPSFVETGDNVMIGGFIVQGMAPKRVIVRAIGPELTQYGVPNALSNPTLELYNGAGALIGSNDNWQHTIIGGIITSNQVRDIINSGYPPGDGRESAIIADLPAGNYTAIVKGVNNLTGVALIEVYDLSPESDSILANISTRAFVQTGDNVVIGGFTLQGTASERVIVRALGPELTQYGVPDALANPTLELHDSTGALIASNNNWVTTIIGGIITSNQVHQIQASGYAPGNPLESAIIADLPAGNYTAIVRGVNDMTGVALVEVYDLGATEAPTPSPTPTPTPH